MTRRRANYCPECGAAVETRALEGRDRAFCPDCREFVFQNPVPIGAAVVLAGSEVLLVERGIPPDCGKWTVPAGFLEVDESASEGAARELEEETGLAVDPDDLELARTGFHVEDPAEGSLLSVCFGVEREHTRGTVRPGSEPTDARFWDPETLLASDAETRSVDLRRMEAAFQAVRGQERSFDSE
jgi:ADP-ribose pyrophosphatase YjhB (NUDIX family)